MRKKYEEACNAYLKAFCKKHGFDFSEASWVGDNIGGVACVADDLFIGMEEIRADMDLDAPEAAIFSWLDYQERLSSIEAKWHGLEGFMTFARINYRSWVKGAPLPYTEQDLGKLEDHAQFLISSQEKFRQKCRGLCASGE